ncbi:uncharacterized protein BT62DRAFT_984572 [Guyanagaster necrorhizus]|uniref:Uncharacterized protein n=1 Tax=Guyanagaster necrorhizus TaxID=856835 RepID=A0A9P8AZ04_9AGAR|nr:uncharacterized protein BT62DRAFT_984572 [Guyanagaster necrorhizus MCA 3950]KAG7451462.1 hypothetical protein BT62DRAFT_984572 [Guyanagaster necrorhizus MCA 3950]
MSEESSSQRRALLSEQQIQDAFHSYLRSSLTQAKVERLLDENILSSAEGDLMITGPALCLYFAALRCTTNPPSVPLPRRSKSPEPTELSAENCPPAFTSFLSVWAKTVPSIQELAPQYQHDLARIICGLEPLSAPPLPSLQGIAADLRAVAIEISQRRSFQDQYASDLQAALDSGRPLSSPRSVKASFVPPPSYDAPPPSHQTSPRPSIDRASHELPAQTPAHLSPHVANSSSGWPSRSASPTILAPNSPAIEFIRETLYASLADALDRQPTLRALLKRDPPRAYFASVAFAILDVATTSMTPEGGVVGVLGQPLMLSDCPIQLQPFMVELAAIGRDSKELEAEDDRTAMQYAQQGRDIPAPRMERVRKILEEGVGYSDRHRDEDNGRRSVEGKAVAFANRINALSLGMTRLKAFRERQEYVFTVLASIGST